MMKGRRVGRAVSIIIIVAAVGAMMGVGVHSVAHGRDPKIKLGLITYPYKIQWMEAYDAGFTWYCEDHGIPYIVQKPEELTTEAQINACRALLLLGVNGIIVTPISDAAGNEVVRLAKEKGVPVMTTNVDVDNPDIVMSVSFSSSEAGKICGEHIVEYLENKYGKPRGKVLELWYMPGNIQNRKRHEGFHKVVDKYPDIEVFEQMIEKGTPTEGKTGTMAAFRAGRTFDAIYGINCGCAHGAILALKELGYNPEDQYVAHLDSDIAALQFLAEGYSDITVDQPTQFYNAIAVKYLVDYIQKGESALPKVGTITAEELDISGKLHGGVDPWANSKQWSPARVIMSHDLDPELYQYNHLCFVPHPNLITKENCDDPTLWARLPIE